MKTHTITSAADFHDAVAMIGDLRNIYELTLGGFSLEDVEELELAGSDTGFALEVTGYRGEEKVSEKLDWYGIDANPDERPELVIKTTYATLYERPDVGWPEGRPDIVEHLRQLCADLVPVDVLFTIEEGRISIVKGRISSDDETYGLVVTGELNSDETRELREDLGATSLQATVPLTSLEGHMLQHVEQITVG